MIGRTISHFQITAKLGEGGMGAVYRALDRRLGREVALKILPVAFTKDASRVARFEREAKALAALNHPNIATIYEVGDGREDVPHLVMELVEGGTLAEETPGGGLDLDRFLELAISLTDALAAAHRAGIVHRDLKPANIMITRDGQPKILDFGLAKQSFRGDVASDADTVMAPERLTRTGAYLGTRPYMAPEQILGGTVDHRSDLFSLGLVLWEMLGGTRPFGGSKPEDVARAIVQDEPSDLRSLRPDLPLEIGAIIMRCLAKDPEGRFQSAEELGDALRALSEEDREGEIRQAVAAEASKTKRRYLGAAMAVGVLAAIALVAGLMLDQGRTQPPVAPGPAIRSLAVLPFSNLMDDPEQNYLVDGIHEALITELSKIGDLRVISRTSAAQYRKTPKSTPVIAEELGVEGIVEGSVLLVGQRVRFRAQLIDGAADEHLWGDSYDEDFRDILSMLSRVAENIALEIEVALSPDQVERLAGAPTVDPAAYEAYLRSRHSYFRFTGEGFRESLEHARQAIELDPELPQAYAALSAAYFTLGAFGYEPLGETVPKSEAAALRALELDSTIADAHAGLAWIRLWIDRDWQAGRERALEALRLDPSNPTARHALAEYYLAAGKADESVEQVRLAQLADPLTPASSFPVAFHLLAARRYEEALEEVDRLNRVFSERGPAEVEHVVLWHLGRQQDAMVALRKYLESRGTLFPDFDGLLGKGGPQAVLSRLAESTALAPDGDPLVAAKYYALAGENDKALEWAETAERDRVPQMIQIRVHPTFDPLRDEPRFETLLRQMAFPDQAG